MKQNPDDKESPRDGAFKQLSDHPRWASVCSNHDISVTQVIGSADWVNENGPRTRGIYGFAWLGSKKDQTDSAAPSGGKTINILVNDPTQTAREIWFTRTLNCVSFSIMVLAKG
jgi:hypothetical protein